MGTGFVILIHLVGIFILSTAIALVGSILVYCTGSKQTRPRRLFFATAAPFTGLFSLYFFYLTAAVIISGLKDTDIGIGDTWYIPLSRDSRLLFIDLPEQAYIEYKGQTIIDEVSHLDMTGDTVTGQTYDHTYFIYNATTGTLQVSDKPSSDIPAVQTEAWDFYIARKNALTGNWVVMAGMLAAGISVGIIWWLGKLLFKHRQIKNPNA